MGPCLLPLLTPLWATPQRVLVFLQLQDVLLQLAQQEAQLFSLRSALLLLVALLSQHEDELRVRAGGHALDPPWALSQPHSPSLGLTPLYREVTSLAGSWAEAPALWEWVLLQVMGALNQEKTSWGQHPGAPTKRARPLTAASLLTWLQARSTPARLFALRAGPLGFPPASGAERPVRAWQAHLPVASAVLGHGLLVVLEQLQLLAQAVLGASELVILA